VASRLAPLLQKKQKAEGRALPGLLVIYWTSSPSTFCRATQTFGNRVAERVATRQWSELLDIQPFDLLPRHADLRQPDCRTRRHAPVE